MILSDLIRGDNIINTGTISGGDTIHYTTSIGAKTSGTKGAKQSSLTGKSSKNNKSHKKEKMKTSILELSKNTTPRIYKVPGNNSLLDNLPMSSKTRKRSVKSRF